MARARFTPLAKEDLKAINRYIAQDNPEAARRLIAQIRAQCRTLADFPEMGRLWEELTSPLRSFPVGNYLIFCFIVSGFPRLDGDAGLPPR